MSQLTEGVYRMIYADPPWKYNDARQTGTQRRGGTLTGRARASLVFSRKPSFPLSPRSREAGHLPVTAAASYARQADDRELEVMAKRIHARAYGRMGELLKSSPAARLGRMERRGEHQLSTARASRPAVVIRTIGPEDGGLPAHSMICRRRKEGITV
jgi:hypothetical protein